MTVLEAIILGLTQGAAEFLPISSSGHLVIVPALFGWDKPAVAFDVLLHLGTLLAVIVYFRADLWRMVRGFFSTAPERAPERRLAWLIIIGTIPTGLIGLAFDDVFERLFGAVLYVGVFLMVTAVILTLAEWLSRQRAHDPSEMRWWQAALIGVAQGAAIAPGISRAGSTMAAGLAIGLDREQAARFSFLLSVPSILLAGAWAARELLGGGVVMPSPGVSALGFLAAAVSGYAAIAGLLAYLRKRPLYPFAAYCAVAGLGIIVWQLLG
ncbi:MAG: undecaprenyl-diphosphatase UppP [Coriobacteriia bacterium]|nr:undecaprenyl-diphosphatase UppP [Coriobacteriia bacterium]